MEQTNLEPIMEDQLRQELGEELEATISKSIDIMF